MRLNYKLKPQRLPKKFLEANYGKSLPNEVLKIKLFYQ